MDGNSALDRRPSRFCSCRVKVSQPPNGPFRDGPKEHSRVREPTRNYFFPIYHRALTAADVPITNALWDAKRTFRPESKGESNEQLTQEIRPTFMLRIMMAGLVWGVWTGA
jgi:hypothetical protein